jgi:hypothetical protein
MRRGYLVAGHASGSCVAIGDRDRVIPHALAAGDIDPGSFEFAFHAGCLLEPILHILMLSLVGRRSATSSSSSLLHRIIRYSVASATTK